MPWLDELVALSIDGRFVVSFHRIQALWSSVVHVVAPFGLEAGDVRFDKNVVVIARQTYPGKSGLITKQTKGQGAPRPDPRPAPADPGTPHEEEGARRSTAGRPERRRSHHSDRARRDELGSDRQGSRPARPRPPRSPAHRATWMADAGIPLHVLQDILGHASVETTRGYPTLSSPAPPRPAASPVATRRGPCRGVWRSAPSVWSPLVGCTVQRAPEAHGRLLPGERGARRGPTKTRRRT